MKAILTILIMASSIVLATEGETTKKLSPSISGGKEVVFSHNPKTNSLTAALALENGQRMILPVQCDPEGGEPSLSDSYSVKLPDGSEALIITCSYHLDHSGLGITGVQYTSFVLAETSNSLERKENLEGLISGYEGTTEEGAREHFFYNTKELATQKLKDGDVDSPALIHRVLLSRLVDHDYEAITSYASDDNIRTTITRTPISKADATSYNDIGFALAEVGELDLALRVLRNVEILLLIALCSC
ncbi:hypothetical protein [Pseudomonas sp. PIC25]|uniref:hypothetical protein n=1 Tax=Pseudomonas sp. PIC25 TaxID=1958773 RepID=UPI00117A8B30|nr:hypothetical protein [Pseudomonas sp. PIC25]